MKKTTFKDTKPKISTAFICFFLAIVATPINSYAVCNTISTINIEHKAPELRPREYMEPLFVVSDHYYKDIKDIPEIHLENIDEKELIQKFDEIESDMAVFYFEAKKLKKFGVIFKWKCKKTGKKGYQAILFFNTSYTTKTKALDWHEISEKSEFFGKLVPTEHEISIRTWPSTECLDDSPFVRVSKLLSGEEFELSDGTIAVSTKTPIENEELLLCEENLKIAQQKIEELEKKIEDETRKSKNNNNKF